MGREGRGDGVKQWGGKGWETGSSNGEGRDGRWGPEMLIVEGRVGRKGSSNVEGRGGRKGSSNEEGRDGRKGSRHVEGREKTRETRLVEGRRWRNPVGPDTLKKWEKKAPPIWKEEGEGGLVTRKGCQ